MDRLRRLAEFWSWLPAFRAVGETEHLLAASRELLVSASALSRTIHLLEGNLGRPLFVRVGRGLTLSTAGKELLSAVRSAMRLVDEGLRRVTARGPAGPVLVSTTGPVTDAVLVVLERLQRRYPELVFHLHHHPAAEVRPLLLQGKLDLAFLGEPVSHERLVVERVADFHSGIYCGRTHPLFRRRRLRLSEVLRFPFAAPVKTEDGAGASDGWPPEIPRKVGMLLTQLRAAVQVCQRGHLLAALPDLVARRLGSRRPLRRLPLEVIPPMSIYAVRREPVGEGDLVPSIVRSVRRELDARAPGRLLRSRRSSGLLP